MIRLFLIRFSLHARIYFTVTVVILMMNIPLAVMLGYFMTGTEVADGFVAFLSEQAIYFIIAIIVLLCLILLFARIVAHTISAPILRMHEVIKRLNAGEKDVDVDVAKKGEIGQMAKSMSEFKGKMEEYSRQTSEQLAHDEEARARYHRMTELAKIFEGDMNSLLDNVSTSSDEMSHVNVAVLQAAKETYDHSDEISQITQQATNDVQMVASATEEMSVSAKEISKQMQISLTTVQNAAHAVEEADKTVKNMSALSAQIGDIISLINDIAGQTNLLALNATIEAARAGEAGKGFAVVANEVKNLASQTTKATEDISAQINSIRDISNQSVTAMGTVHQQIGTINDIIGSVSASIEEQTATNNEITNASSSASQRTIDASKRVDTISEHAKVTLEKSELMDRSVSNTSSSVKLLQEKMKTFLRELADLKVN